MGAPLFGVPTFTNGQKKWGTPEVAVPPVHCTTRVLAKNFHPKRSDKLNFCPKIGFFRVNLLVYFDKNVSKLSDLANKSCHLLGKRLELRNKRQKGLTKP